MFDEKSIETETTTSSELPNGGKATAEKNTTFTRNKQIRKSKTAKVTVKDPSRKIKHLKSFEIAKP